jgi:hypothetical protein
LFEQADMLHIIGPEPLEAGRADQYIVTSDHFFLPLTKEKSPTGIDSSHSSHIVNSLATFQDKFEFMIPG